MKFYKIRHKSSGLFYKPIAHKSPLNVSKQGKVYQKRPSEKWIIGQLFLGYGSIGYSKEYDACRKGENIEFVRNKPLYSSFILSEWEIVEYETIENIISW